jgi:hypothetical protein
MIGANTDLDNGQFLNDPHGVGQMGCVVSTDQIEITQGAKDLLSNAQREGGSFAPIMIMKGSIGLMGFGCHAFDTTEPVLSRDCDLSVLDTLETTDLEVPQDFIDYVDSL